MTGPQQVPRGQQGGEHQHRRGEQAAVAVHPGPGRWRIEQHRAEHLGLRSVRRQGLVGLVDH
jgi:hypothetical protein